MSSVLVKRIQTVLLCLNLLLLVLTVIFANLQPKLLGILPSLASHSVMIPLVVQTIMPMLSKDTRPYVSFADYPLLSYHFLVLIFFLFLFSGGVQFLVWTKKWIQISLWAKN